MHGFGTFSVRVVLSLIMKNLEKVCVYNLINTHASDNLNHIIPSIQSNRAIYACHTLCISSNPSTYLLQPRVALIMVVLSALSLGIAAILIITTTTFVRAFPIF